MQAQAQLITNCDTTTWQRQDQSRLIVTVLDQSINKPSTGLFAIPERHAPPFRLVNSPQTARHADSDEEHG
jgi:hypothetical protein